MIKLSNRRTFICDARKVQRILFEVGLLRSSVESCAIWNNFGREGHQVARRWVPSKARSDDWASRRVHEFLQ